MIAMASILIIQLPIFLQKKVLDRLGRQYESLPKTKHKRYRIIAIILLVYIALYPLISAILAY
jgi:hypothetical protein